jgi:uncharacterized protein
MYVIERRQRMKLSKFNIIVDNKDLTCIIYNSSTGGILELDGKYKKMFLKASKSNDFSNLPKDLLDTLKAGDIIKDDIDEIAALKIFNNMVRMSSDNIGLTIAPTTTCNFRCPYCYEKGASISTMDDKIINETINFINKMSIDKNQLNITWYGGEPLLHVDIIEKITNGIVDKERLHYNANIVTNGYFLTREMAEKLYKLNVMYAQITINGPPEIHNIRRCLPNGEDTFYVIMKNIENICDILRISIRVNVDKENICRVDEILNVLEQKNLIKKVGLYLAPVDNINESCNQHNCLNSLEFSKEEAEFIRRNLKRGYNFINIPSGQQQICGAVSLQSYIIDPLGNLYKCWDEIGRKETSVGSVFEPITLNANMIKWLGYNFLDFHKECEDCNILPLCMGGCPYHNYNAKEKHCHALKYNAKEMVAILSDYKKSVRN